MKPVTRFRNLPVFSVPCAEMARADGFARMNSALRPISGSTTTCGKKGFRCYWSHELYSTLTLHSLLARLKSMQIQGPDFNLTDELLIADCIRCDLAVRTPSGLQWNIPVFHPDQAQQLIALLGEAAAPLADELLPVASILYERMKMEIPPHLHDQISGVFLSELCSIIQMVCQILLERGCLQKPTSELFAGRIMMLCGEKPSFWA